jgi:hypothetical protein
LLDEVRRPDFGGRDYKSSLQEYLQGRDYPLPDYLVASESGPDHRKLFQVEVRVRDEVIGRAQGRSKKEAEQEAARLALERLRQEPDVRQQESGTGRKQESGIGSQESGTGTGAAGRHEGEGTTGKKVAGGQ